MNTVSRVLVEPIRGGVTQDPLVCRPNFRSRDGVCMLVGGRTQDSAPIFPRRVNHLSRLQKRIGERPINQVRQPCFEVGLMQNMVPWIVVIPPGNDSVNLAQHIVEVPDGFAVVHLRELRRFLRINLPAMSDPHARKRNFLISCARIYQRRPQRKQM